MAHQEFGYRLLQKIMQILPEVEKERPERFEGRRLVCILKQSKGKPKEKNNVDQNESNQPILQTES